MKRIIFLATALGAMILASCSNEQEVMDQYPEELSDNTVAIQFAPSINGATLQTRAHGSVWTPGDAIGVFMVDYMLEVVNEMDNKAYETKAGEKYFRPKSVADTIYYPADNSEVDFISYYPYQQGVSLGAPYYVDVRNQSNPIDIDLLYAVTNSGYQKNPNKTVKLLFDHKLTHLVLNILPGMGLSTDELKGMKVTVKGLKTMTIFDLQFDDMNEPYTVADIKARQVTDGKKYDAILIPQAVTLGVMSIEFEIDGANGNKELYVWKAPATTFAEKTEYIYNVSISRKGVNVEGEINDWISGPSENITIN